MEERDLRAALGKAPAATPALIDGERGTTLTHGALRAALDGLADALARRGIGEGDTVAILAKDGAMAVQAFLAVAAAAISAPLNPAYKERELEFYLGDLKPALLLVEPGIGDVAAGVAATLGIPVAGLALDASGALGLAADAPVAAAGGARREAGLALLLHTSGTTSTPKLVPLTRPGLLASARAIGRTLALGPDDRALCIMPLFHIHGLMATVLAPLLAGGSIVTTSGFSAFRIEGWLREHRPSWYSAVPSMHQAILSRCAPAVLAGAGLRFVRSSSAALPPPVFGKLQAALGCPVIEAYGMTEAAHQITSNPLPPGRAAPGSVGLAAGSAIAVLTADGRIVEGEGLGEILIRGAAVTPGYLDNPTANAEAFVDGWFRTGDIGRVDAEGRLVLDGRIKEMINRGGEKIAPAEIDAVLLSHPDVAQAVAFARPHARLGEEVAAAVVPAGDLDMPGLRRFLGERLAAFKVPRTILVVDDIPKGPTGKLRRIGLAAQLGLVEDVDA